MCLTRLNVTTTEKLRKSSKPIICWKVVNHEAVYSLFFNYIWKLGLNKSSRNTTKLNDIESKYNHIYQGFHVFKTRKLAREWAKRYAYKILRCEGNPKDLVGVGKWDNGTTDTLVFTKLNAIKVVY